MKKMSRLEELIAELCPDGVGFVKLHDVAQISAGGDLPENYIKGQKEPSDEYPFVPRWSIEDNRHGL